MAVFLKRMQAADVIHGTQEGKILEQVSLFEPAAPSDPPASSIGWLARMRAIFKGHG